MIRLFGTTDEGGTPIAQVQQARYQASPFDRVANIGDPHYMAFEETADDHILDLTNPQEPLAPAGFYVAVVEVGWAEEEPGASVEVQLHMVPTVAWTEIGDMGVSRPGPMTGSSVRVVGAKWVPDDTIFRVTLVHNRAGTGDAHLTGGCNLWLVRLY